MNTLVSNKVLSIVVAVLLVSSLFLGYKAYTLSKRVSVTENAIAQIVAFINQAVAQSQK